MMSRRRFNAVFSQEIRRRTSPLAFWLPFLAKLITSCFDCTSTRDYMAIDNIAVTSGEIFDRLHSIIVTVSISDAGTRRTVPAN